jgi:hypothetical protein
MQNVKLAIKNDILTITIDLNEEGELSRSCKSLVVASTGGNVPLIDGHGYRPERINLSVSKPLPKDDE